MKNEACSYVEEAMAARDLDDSTYEKYLHIRQNMTEVFSINFNLTKEVLNNASYVGFALLGDVVFAEIFEDIPQ